MLWHCRQGQAQCQELIRVSAVVMLGNHEKIYRILLVLQSFFWFRQ